MSQASAVPSTSAPGRREGVVNLWQRGVPVFDAPILTKAFVALAVLALAGTAIAGLRTFQGNLGGYSAMNDYYAWGVWKTFNVMALTALGSGGLAVGIATWVLGRNILHTVMRTAMLTSLLFYTTGLIALGTDVGRPWNFWNIALPWRWNIESSLWEVSLAMPLYTFVFLLYENSPTVVERFWLTGSPRARAFIRHWKPRMRSIYPYMVSGAYTMPVIHQSSLGALLLLAGDKIHPLWQTPMLPVLYLLQAGICGFGAVIVFLMTSCLVWRRPLDMKVLSELSNLLSWLTLGWLAIRLGDIAISGKLGYVFTFDRFGVLFAIENFMMALPALVFRSPRMRSTPRVVFKMAVLATLGGLVYRFIPTTVTYDPGAEFSYFPSVPEVIVSGGFVAMAVAAFGVAVKLFAVLPAPFATWQVHVEDVRRHDPNTRRDSYGNPLDD